MASKKERRSLLLPRIFSLHVCAGMKLVYLGEKIRLTDLQALAKLFLVKDKSLGKAMFFDLFALNIVTKRLDRLINLGLIDRAERAEHYRISETGKQFLAMIETAIEEKLKEDDYYLLTRARIRGKKKGKYIPNNPNRWQSRDKKE